MKYSLLAILLVLFAIGCYEELPEIEPVVLHESDIPLFAIDSVTVLAESPEFKMRIHYSSRYEELTEEQKSSIGTVSVAKNGNEIYRERILRTTNTGLYFDDIILEPAIICYKFSFVDRNRFLSRPTELCVEEGLEAVPPSTMETSVDSLLFTSSENRKSFIIRNIGSEPFNWTLNPGASFLSSNISSGLLPEGLAIQATLEVDRTDLMAEEYMVEVLLENDKGVIFIMPVRILN